MPFSLVLEDDRGRQARFDRDATDTPQQCGTRGFRRLVERVADPGMAEGHNTGNTRNHRGEIEGLRPRRLNRDAVAITHRFRDIMSSGREQVIQQAELFRLLNASRSEPFAANAVDVHKRPFQNQDGQSIPRQARRESAARHTGANNHDIEIFKNGHGGPRAFFGADVTLRSSPRARWAANAGDGQLRPAATICPPYREGKRTPPQAQVRKLRAQSR